MHSTYTGVNFYEGSAWGPILLVAALLGSLILANILKATIFKKMVIPNSVLGGCIILVVSTICFYTTGDYFFNLPAFSQTGNGNNVLELVTYHCLGLGFVAMTLRPSDSKANKQRSVEVVNSGMLTISTYLVQCIIGMIISIIASKFIAGLAPSCGMLLCFGYGQGTGQALNNGKNYDAVLGGGTYANMGLSYAALGFLVASIAGIIAINRLRKRGKIESGDGTFKVDMNEVFSENEVPMTESIDKLSTQSAFVLIVYAISYVIMWALGKLIPGMIGTVYGFNFLFGVIASVGVKGLLKVFRKFGWTKYDYLNPYLLNRISGFAFDLMIVAGICAIQIDLITNYIGLILITATAGAIATFYYVKFVCQKLFPDYKIQQFAAFFGMLTGTASTGMMLLREVDPKIKSPASENLVYQNLPAIVLALPMLVIASTLTSNPLDMSLTLKMFALVAAYFVIIVAVLFRSYLFKKKAKK